MPKQQLKTILDSLDNPQTLPMLTQIQRGIERECLRLDRSGTLAQSAHPQALGSALCHPYITTDFSESLLEFVTPVFTDIDECIEFLKHLHQFTYRHIGEELMWMNSMPCILPGITNIPIARYGNSNSGQMKHVYRVGLSNRYGSAMQTISGIHYNFSVSEQLLNAVCKKNLGRDEISNLYMGLVRNFHRHCWILLYLFGASPAVCKSFLHGNEQHGLELFDSVSYYGPHATSLRMSDLGYRNVAQSRIQIGLRDVDTYISGLRHATEQSYPEYEEIGVKVNGEYRQLNTNLLQIENEYYTVIRPKQIIQSGEKPTTALRNKGIAYVEVRCLDINPERAVGIGKQEIRFVDTFLLYCLLIESPVMSDSEKIEVPENRNRIVRHGRQPDLKLLHNNSLADRKHLMLEFLDRLAPIAALLDKAHKHSLHAEALARQFEKTVDPEATPSAKIITEMRNNDESFFEYAQRKTIAHEKELKQRLLTSVNSELTQVSADSIADQKQREQSDTLDFDDYLQAYFTETLNRKPTA